MPPSNKEQIFQSMDFNTMTQQQQQQQQQNKKPLNFTTTAIILKILVLCGSMCL